MYESFNNQGMFSVQVILDIPLQYLKEIQIETDTHRARGPGGNMIKLLSSQPPSRFLWPTYVAGVQEKYAWMVKVKPHGKEL